jgi:hypothetical protein
VAQENNVPAEFIHAFLANAAEMLPDGRFSALGGGIDGIAVPGFPATLPSVAIVLRFRIVQAEYHRGHVIGITLTRPDQTDIGVGALVRHPGVQNMGPAIGPFEQGMIVNVVVNLSLVSLTMPGVYVFNFTVDGAQIGTLSVPVVAM